MNHHDDTVARGPIMRGVLDLLFESHSDVTYFHFIDACHVRILVDTLCKSRPGEQ
jgi:hypothetical protein